MLPPLWLPEGIPVRVAVSFWPRLIGLMFRRRPPPYALVFPNCRAVHTCFVRFPLTLVALDRQGQVIATRRGVPPWRVVVFSPGTWAVGEMADVRAGPIRTRWCPCGREP